MGTFDKIFNNPNGIQMGSENKKNKDAIDASGGKTRSQREKNKQEKKKQEKKPTAAPAKPRMIIN